MSNFSASPGDGAPDPRLFSSLLQSTAAAMIEEPPMPSSKPLQIFLLIALVITGVAYVVNEWTELTTEKVRAKYPSRVREMVQSQSAFLEHTEAGNKALAAKRPDQAVSEFRLALQSEASAEGHQNLAAALLQMGDTDAAFAQFREAVRVDPKLMTAYAAWGQALSAQGKPEEAVEVYQTALKENAESGIVQYALATTLQNMQHVALAARRAAEAAGQTDEAASDGKQAESMATQALQHFTKASREGINTPAFWTGYGELLNDQSRFSEAEIALKRAVAADPELGKARLEIARSETRLGKYDEAIGNYEKVLTLNPDSPEVLNSLALIYTTATNSEIRSPKMGVLLATRACDATTSQNARFMDTLAQAYAQDGNFFQAITWEEKAIKRAKQLSDGELGAQLESRYQLYVEHRTY